MLSFFQASRALTCLAVVLRARLARKNGPESSTLAGARALPYAYRLSLMDSHSNQQVTQIPSHAAWI